MNIHQMIARSAICLMGLLGLTLFASSVPAQVFDSGPSDPTLFDTVINLPSDPNIGDRVEIGGDSLTTQLNLSNSSSVGTSFTAFFGSEINISGGSVGDGFEAFFGSEVNISGGTVGDFFDVVNGEVNISGGSVGDRFDAYSSMVNISGGTVGNFFEACSGLIPVSYTHLTLPTICSV